MDDLIKEINTEKELISQPFDEFRKAFPIVNKTSLELTGIATFLHNICTLSLKKK